ncbi:SDR family NAD(P)-dependent oxidoreductase [Marinobacter sp. M1N3S26]|uniref:SDR family NAD(P)-dependent oxidoreductase n=1 Tax=Marinobacter sp. M1N3S26 TaxID=3382299 RepID=UPI00387A9228
MGRLNDKVVVITGGTGGIGKVTAELFLNEGASVVVVDLDQSAIDKTVSELAVHGPVTGVKADVSKEDEVAAYVKAAVDTYGRIDVFFNNAGIEGKVAPIPEQAIEDFDKVFGVNVRGVFLGLKHVLPVMYQQKSGSVINMSSVAGLTGSAGVTPYVGSKHAVVGITKSAALEAGPYNVRVNSVHPSPVNTRMMRSLEEGFNPGHGAEAKAALEQGIPLGRYAESIDIANCVLFLASDDSSFVSGSMYRIDGGMCAD